MNHQYVISHNYVLSHSQNEKNNNVVRVANEHPAHSPTFVCRRRVFALYAHFKKLENSRTNDERFA
jgi:hypothetical protein